MDTIFAFSLCLAPSHWYLMEKSFYTLLVPQILWLPPRGNLDFVDNGAYAQGSHRYITKEKVLLVGCHLLGIAKNNQDEVPSLKEIKKEQMMHK